ncbi:MAG: hypothetical protein KDA20_08400 [Phycisphaerales bacterium]|nr:hypothetical protein [Phycisphaerales bacterium]
MLTLKTLPWEAYSFSEEEYADRAFVKPDVEILREYMVKQKRVRIRRFKYRYVDGTIYQFTADHMIYIDFDAVTLSYNMFYIPYSDIKTVTLLRSKEDLILIVNKIGALTPKIGPEAPDVMAEIEQRRGSA